jgi:hypothetical protein
LLRSPGLAIPAPAKVEETGMKLIVFAAVVASAVPALAQDTPQPASTPATAGTAVETPGGYAPPPAAPPPPGATIVFKPAPPPDVAFPPPAPLAKYPVCGRGQTDHCIQRNDPK